MLIILLTRSQNLPSLESAIADSHDWDDWAIIDLQEFEINGQPVNRVALICDNPPPDSPDFTIEAIIDHRYCPECFKEGKFNRLPGQNKSGWCWPHQDKNPARARRKLKNRKGHNQ